MLLVSHMDNLLLSDFQTVMETFQPQFLPCLRWFFKCIAGLPPQQRMMNR
jgi:hypothetical protein